MTSVVDRAPARDGGPEAPRDGKAPRRSYRARRATYPRRRERIALSLLAVVVTAYLGLMVQQYDRARTLLREQEQQAARAHRSLDSAKATIRWADGEIAATRESTDLTREEAAQRVRERDLLRAGIKATRVALADAGARLGLTEAAVFIIGLHQKEVSDCLAGVDAATDALGVGNDDAAISALRAAAPACATALAAANGTRFPFDFADPAVLRAGDTYYAYSTNAGVGDIQVIRSADLVTWEVVGNALPSLPAWAAPNRTWAPSVLAVNGVYVAYYTAQDSASGRQCISRAVGSSPAGPFVDDSTPALVCQLDHGGSIDPTPFVADDGSPWLLWKSEGFGADPPILWSQQLGPDGLSLVGPSSQLIRADQGWERGVIEGPAMARDASGWYLFYSGADWKTRQYAIGYARCDGPAGPCHKPSSAPVVVSDGRIAGPGGQELFRDGSGRLWMAFHAYSEPDVGYPSSRTLHLLLVRFANGAPVFEAGI